MDAWLQILRNIGTARLGAMAGIAVGLVAFFVFLTTRLATPNMALLFNELEAVDSGQIIAQLEAQNVPYESRNQGKEILVPTEKVGQLRISLAAQGLPNSGSVGYEIFDKDQSITTSSEIQNINRLRALEGELARTIASLDPVASARVHLVLPRRELFTRERQDPSASITLRMRGSRRLDRSQVLAVQHLAAAAVPGLQPGRISIVDDSGTLLSRGGGEGANAFGGATPEEMRTQYETRLRDQVTELLEKTVGFGRVRVKINAVMDFDRIVTNQELYDPEGQVVRSTQSITENSQEQNGPDEAVSVGQNLPDAQNIQGAGTSSSVTNRSDEKTNFEISKTVRNHVREAGTVQKLYAAVLVDGKYPNQGQENAGEATAGANNAYEPRSAEEMEQIRKLVEGAIGYNAERGDTIEVVNLRFVQDPVLEEDLGPQEILGFRQSDLLRTGEVLVLAVVGVLVVLLVVRPLITRIFEATAAATEAVSQVSEQQMITDQRQFAGGAPPALAATQVGGGGLPAAGGDVPAPPEDDDVMINLNNIEGRVKASSLRKIGEIIEKHPEEAVSIMRTWMYQE